MSLNSTMGKLTHAIHHHDYSPSKKKLFLFLSKFPKAFIMLKNPNKKPPKITTKKHNKIQTNNPNSYLHNTLLLYQAKILKYLIYAVAWRNTDLLPTEVNEFNKISKSSSLDYLMPLRAKNEKVKKIQAV